MKQNNEENIDKQIREIREIIEQFVANEMFGMDSGLGDDNGVTMDEVISKIKKLIK